MTKRRVILASDEYYHVYNRSIGKEDILVNKHDQTRFYNLVQYYRFHVLDSYSHISRLPFETQNTLLAVHYSQLPLIKILAYAVMPNHYHFIVQQLVEGGIKSFISNLQNSYAKYYNVKHERHGGLFCNSFKAKHIETQDELLHIIRYAEINAITGFLIDFKDLENYPHSSYSKRYKGIETFIDNEFIYETFKDKVSYKSFIENQVDYQRRLKEISRLLIDNR